MANVGIAPPQYDTPVGQFRALIGDTEYVALDPPQPGLGDYAWYSDAEITGLLSVYNGNARRAGAQALRTIASSQALLLKKWSADDLSVDGAAIAEALRKLANDLDNQSDSEDSSTDIFALSYPGAGPGNWIAELSTPIWGRRYTWDRYRR